MNEFEAASLMEWLILRLCSKSTPQRTACVTLTGLRCTEIVSSEVEVMLVSVDEAVGGFSEAMAAKCFA